MPNLIDKSVFTGLSWSVQTQLFTGFKFLGLTDDVARPTQDVETLVKSEEPARKAKLKSILEAKYAPLFALNLEKGTPSEVEKKIGEVYGLSGDTPHKAYRFFLSACEYSGVMLSGLLAPGKKDSSNGLGARKRAPKRRQQSAQPKETGAPASSGTSKTIELASGGTLTLSASLDLFALSVADRTFVFALIDKLETYAQPKGETKE